MIDFTTIGTEENFLRPSKLDRLVVCTMQHALDLEIDEEDVSGPAADTGSLVHSAVAEFHMSPSVDEGIARAWAALTANAHKFPLSDSNEARLFLKPYLEDPRNLRAKVHAIERLVKLTLPPHEIDPTGQPVVIQGTLDQIREEFGQLWVFDLKTGKPTGFDMIHAHTYQQAAYTLAAAAEGFPVVGAKLIRNWSYRHRGAALPSPEGVFLEMPFDLETAGILLDRVRVAVANLRAGKIEFGPGHACTFCRHGGLAACLPEARRRFGF